MLVLQRHRNSVWWNRAPLRTTPEEAGQTRVRRAPSRAVDRISCPRLQWPRIVALVRLQMVRNPLNRCAEMVAKIAPETVDLLLDAVLHPPEVVGDELRVEQARRIGIP